MKHTGVITYTLLCLALAACQKDEMPMTDTESHQLTFETDVVPFEGEGSTRVTPEGDGFENDDWIRLKIICPYVDSAEHGENTYGNSYDAFYLLKKTDSGWTPLTASDSCDINGTYKYSGSPNPNSYYEAQQTPYVFMASTWSEEKSFRAPNGEVLQYCHVFHADQSEQKKYKASDLLWAQQYMQTGTWNVKLAFRHVMTCLEFTVNDDALDSELKITNDAVLTLEGMPDIDQQEVVVGDYYALRSKVNSRFGYREKNCCDYKHNGKVIGVGVNDFNTKSTLDSQMGRAFARPMSGNPLHACSNATYGKAYIDSERVPNTGTYRALLKETKVYRLIVPPCVLTQPAQIWVRQGEHRYKAELSLLTFESGKLYKANVVLNPKRT